MMTSCLAAAAAWILLSAPAGFSGGEGSLAAFSGVPVLEVRERISRVQKLGPFCLSPRGKPWIPELSARGSETFTYQVATGM